MNKGNDEIQKRTQLLKKRVNEIGQTTNKTNQSNNEPPVKEGRKLTFSKKTDESKKKLPSTKTSPKRRAEDDNKNAASKRSKVDTSSSQSTNAQVAKTGSFAVQLRIVQFLKDRFLNKDHSFLSIDEIMTELKENHSYDLINHFKTFLKENFKIETQEDTFRFKPRYIIRNRADLLNIIRTRHSMGLPTQQDDVLESHRKGHIFIKKLLEAKEICSLETKREHKVILLIKDNVLPIPEDTDISIFKNLYFATKIEERDREKYRKEKDNNIQTDGTEAVRTFKKPSAQKTKHRKRALVIKSNAHLADTLIDYSKA